MPAAPRTAAKAAARTRIAPAPKPASRWERIKAEADRMRGGNVVEPYVLDITDPPIAITAPEDTERQVGLTEVFGQDGSFRTADARRILELICGDAFPQVWEAVRKEHITVLVALIQDMTEHFESAALDAGDVPGGSEASST